MCFRVTKNAKTDRNRSFDSTLKERQLPAMSLSKADHPLPPSTDIASPGPNRPLRVATRCPRRTSTPVQCSPEYLVVQPVNPPVQKHQARTPAAISRPTNRQQCVTQGTASALHGLATKANLHHRSSNPKFRSASRIRSRPRNAAASFTRLMHCCVQSTARIPCSC